MADEGTFLRRCSLGELDDSYRAVFMPQGLGDILFFLMYVGEYRNVIPEQRIAVVVTKKHFLQLAELFAGRVDAVCYLDSTDEPAWRHRMVYLYDGIYSSGTQPYLVRAIQSAMGLGETARAYIPRLPRPDYMDAEERKRDLVSGQSVLIAPDAVSCDVNISDETWIKIGDICAQAGYRVFFNAGELGRFGSYPAVFLSLVETMNFISDGGAFLSFRSGLCDVMAAFTDVNALIVYPNNKQPGAYPSIQGYDVDPNGAYMRYCSLKNIFPDKRITEFVYETDEALLQAVSKEVKKWRES